jgi:hypothetical protein
VLLVGMGRDRYYGLGADELIGILVDWMNDSGCGGGGVFDWGGFSFRGSRCGQWRVGLQMKRNKISDV